jgi:hypothetical protein
MVFSSMKQILSDVHDADVFVVTLFRKQWSHPLFTSMIAGPTGSGQSMFVWRYVPNIKHMMTPKPDRSYGVMVNIRRCMEP